MVRPIGFTRQMLRKGYHVSTDMEKFFIMKKMYNRNNCIYRTQNKEEIIILWELEKRLYVKRKRIQEYQLQMKGLRFVEFVLWKMELSDEVELLNYTVPTGRESAETVVGRTFTPAQGTKKKIEKENSVEIDWYDMRKEEVEKSRSKEVEEREQEMYMEYTMSYSFDGTRDRSPTLRGLVVARSSSSANFALEESTHCTLQPVW